MKKQIALRAWELVTEFHSLKKLNFFPSMFGMIWLLLILFYQIAFTVVGVSGKTDDVLNFLYTMPSQPYFLPVLAAIIVVFLLYAVLSPIARGGMIHMMHTYRQNQGKKFHRSWQGFFDGLSHFLPIFEVQNITAIFAPITIITFTIFLLRLFGSDFITIIGVAMGLYLLFAFLINMCFSYAPFFIIFENKK